jgi:hypothetical protein
MVLRQGAALAVCLFCLGSNAQEPDAQQNRVPNPLTAEPVQAPAGQNPGASEPSAAETPKPEALPAQVIEVAGAVEWALEGVSVLATEGWAPVKVGDHLSPSTQIRTGLRSRVNLQFGQTTTISVRSATHANIDQFYRSATTEHVRMGLGYGTVRGGSSEGEIRSDVVIDSTVATLAKRGTEGWEMRVEPVTGRFTISLAEYGLVEAIQKLGADRSRSKLVRPGEYADHVNIANQWIKQDIFNRTMNFFDNNAVTDSDAAFDTDHTRGYTVVAPGAGSRITAVTSRAGAAAAIDQPGGRPPGHDVLEPGAVSRPEGNFGTGGSFKKKAPGGKGSRKRP